MKQPTITRTYNGKTLKYEAKCKASKKMRDKLHRVLDEFERIDEEDAEANNEQSA